MTAPTVISETEVRRVRRGITPKMRREILGPTDDREPCVYCGLAATEIDHVVPVTRGGGIDRENLVPACYECNSQKRDLTPDEWARNRRAEGKPWPIPHYETRMLHIVNSGKMSLPVVPSGDGRSESDVVCAWVAENFAELRGHLVALRDVDLGGGAE